MTAHTRAARSGMTALAVLVATAAGGATGALAWGGGSANAPQASAPTVTVTAEPTASVPAVTAPTVEAAPVDAEVTATPHPSLNDPDSLWVVVNKLRPLEPIDYVPEDLVSLSGIPGGSSQQMRAEAAEALTQMRGVAADAGAGFSVSTAYRSYGFQDSLFSGYAARRGEDVAETFSARPGYSEHQTGLGVDVYSSSACRIKACFGDEDAGRWLAEHAWEHGFIIRYPEGSQEVTGYVYEPWHLRYVGTELAAAMHESGSATMEEHLGLAAAPDYE